MKKNAWLVGLFLLVAVALIVAGVITLGGRGLFSTRLKAVVYFDGQVRGLYVGAPVTFRGVKIGDVEAIGIEVNPTTLAARIPVGLNLGADTLRMGGADGKHLSDLPDLVRRGLRAKLILQSVVTGQAAIDLDFKPDTPLHLLGGGHGPVPEIPAMRDKLDGLLEQISNLPLSDLVHDLRRTMDTLTQTLKTTQAVVATTGAQVDKTLLIGAQAMHALQGQSLTTLASIQRLSDSSRQVVLQAQPELLRTLESTRGAAQATELAMSNLADLSAPGAPLRADLELAMRDLSQAARSMRSFSDQLERQPNNLLFGKRESP